MVGTDCKSALAGDSGTPDQLAHSIAPEDVIMPSFKAKLGEDLVLIAFNMSAEEALGTNNTDPDNHGYYFVFQERMGELRFGLDVVDLEETNGVVPAVNDWDDMHWENTTLDNFIDLSQTPSAIDTSLESEWGESAAQMARITNQKPIYFRIRANQLIE